MCLDSSEHINIQIVGVISHRIKNGVMFDGRNKWFSYCNTGKPLLYGGHSPGVSFTATASKEDFIGISTNRVGNDLS